MLYGIGDYANGLLLVGGQQNTHYYFLAGNMRNVPISLTVSYIRKLCTRIA
jgi:hypothetical protein